MSFLWSWWCGDCKCQESGLKRRSAKKAAKAHRNVARHLAFIGTGRQVSERFEP